MMLYDEIYYTSDRKITALKVRCYKLAEQTHPRGLLVLACVVASSSFSCVRC